VNDHGVHGGIKGNGASHCSDGVVCLLEV